MYIGYKILWLIYTFLIIFEIVSTAALTPVEAEIKTLLTLSTQVEPMLNTSGG